jgi:hypothetical protein
MSTRVNQKRQSGRTMKVVGRREAVVQRRRLGSVYRLRRRTMAHARQSGVRHLRRVLHFRMQVKFRNGLDIYLHIGPALLGLIISIVVAVWWPELKPLLQLL